MTMIEAVGRGEAGDTSRPTSGRLDRRRSSLLNIHSPLATELPVFTPHTKQRTEERDVIFAKPKIKLSSRLKSSSSITNLLKNTFGSKHKISTESELGSQSNISDAGSGGFIRRGMVELPTSSAGRYADNEPFGGGESNCVRNFSLQSRNVPTKAICGDTDASFDSLSTNIIRDLEESFSAESSNYIEEIKKADIVNYVIRKCSESEDEVLDLV